MYTGTTPTYTLTLNNDNINLEEATNVYVTFARENREVIVQKQTSDLEIDGNTINVFLTQEDTLRFPNEKVLLQVNWTYEEGSIVKRACSKITSINVSRNLLEEVVE